MNNSGRFEHVAINYAPAAAGQGIIVPGIAGKIVEVWELFLFNTAEQDLHFKDAGTRSLSGPMAAFGAKSGFFLPYTGSPHWELNPGSSLTLDVSVGTQVSGFVLYRLRS